MVRHSSSQPKQGEEMDKGPPREGHTLRREIILTKFPMTLASLPKKKERKGREEVLSATSTGLCKLQSPNLAKFRKLAGQRP